MKSLTQKHLKTLYFNFVQWRDEKCNGMSTLTVQEFYSKYGLENPCNVCLGKLQLSY